MQDNFQSCTEVLAPKYLAHIACVSGVFNGPSGTCWRVDKATPASGVGREEQGIGNANFLETGF
jgi:hypothetical protein